MDCTSRASKTCHATIHATPNVLDAHRSAFALDIIPA
jgi:hypothetical protein